MGYTKNTISGFSWQTVFKVITMVGILLKTMVLARILSPEDFGLFAIIAITLGIAEATTETGVNLTIIQSKRSIKYFIDTAWVIAIIRGFLIGSIMVFLGLFLSNFYEKPELTILVATAALVPVIKGFINPSIVLFHKNLEFFKDGLFKFSVLAVEVTGAVVLALLFESVMALVLALIFSGVYEVILSFIIFKEKPRFQYISTRGKIILSNAKGLSLSAALSYINENVDDFLLGKSIGTYNLGLYHNGYSLGHKVNYDFAKSIHHSILPIFTKISDDTKRIQKAFFKSLFVAVVISLGLSLPLYIAPELIVRIVLGKPEWLEIVPYLHYFVTAGILQSITIIFYSLFYAQKAYRFVNTHLALSVVLLITLLLILPQQAGIQGAGIALIVSRAVPLPLLVFGAYKTTISRKS